MLDRVWWFLTGAVAGGVVVVRALRRAPTSGELGRAVAQTGAEVLDLAARAVRPRK